MNGSSSKGKYVVWGLVLLLLVLHQDLWFWNDGTLVFGFIPIGLFYHACISIGASVVWFVATRVAWPEELIEQVMEDVQSSSSEGQS